jgi:hypothetical protein
VATATATSATTGAGPTGSAIAFNNNGLISITVDGITIFEGRNSEWVV